MRLFLFAGLAVVMVAVCPLAASASIYVGDDNLVGSRSTSGAGEIDGAGGWSGTGDNGFEIHWDITDNGNGSWDYKYWFSGAVVLYDATESDNDPLSKGLSHWILQVSDGKSTDANDFTNLQMSVPYEFEKTGDFVPGDGSSNPELPGLIHGLKWEAPEGSTGGTLNTAWFSFRSFETPVWGDFYAKDGVENPGQVDVVAWNANFGVTPTALGSHSGWIARPNGDVDEPGPNPVPEPSTWLVFSGLFACFGVNAWRKKKRTA